MHLYIFKTAWKSLVEQKLHRQWFIQVIKRDKPSTDKHHQFVLKNYAIGRANRKCPAIHGGRNLYKVRSVGGPLDREIVHEIKVKGDFKTVTKIVFAEGEDLDFVQNHKLTESSVVT